MRSLMFSGYTSAQAGGWANKGSKPSRASRVLSSGGICQQTLGVLACDFQGADPNCLQLAQQSLDLAFFAFLALHVAGTLAQRYLGIFGFYAVSITGGLLSSASE